MLAGVMDVIFPKEHTGEKFWSTICENNISTPALDLKFSTEHELFPGMLCVMSEGMMDS